MTAFRPAVLLATLVGLLAALLVVAPAPTASAAQRLCSGYDPCAGAGYSHDGYAGQSQTHWWRMTLGHNCTNYAAYRMVRSGMANSRPWSGNGDAHRWGHEMAGITDGVPRVGAVAWWDANSGGHGELGHVAYVERVVSADEIVISEDVFNGDFHWTRLTRSGGGWPSGFIHFNDERLKQVAKPRITGKAKVGRSLRVSAGRWSHPVSASYQWLADGRPVRGATRSRFTPGPAEAGDRLRVRVTVRNVGFAPVVVTTGATKPAGRGVLEVTRKVKVTGRPQVGQVLQVRPPRIAPRPDRTTVRWIVGGRVLRGERGRRLTVRPDFAGRQVRVEVVAHRRGYESRTVRARLGTVRKGEIVVTRPFRVTGEPVVGQTLTLVAGRHTPADARSAQLWFRDDQPIDGATGTSYVVTADDVDHRIAVVVGLARRGYRAKLLGVVAGTARP